MTNRCPMCESYTCRCADRALRRYCEDHAFDHHQPNVLRRVALDDAMARVVEELRTRRRREGEERREAEAQDRERRRAAKRQREESETES